jgi:ergothioneine biosynthesis protein EgtB
MLVEAPAPGHHPDRAAEPVDLAARYRAIRRATEDLARPLSAEDAVVQSMPDASPAKWHLAHTTWFFETFVLATVRPDDAPFDPAFNFLFNSYYNAVGPRHARPKRGLLTRPSLERVYAYRAAVDARMLELLEASGGAAPELAAVIEIGLQHEQQHQELIVTDLKHLLSCNPLRPAYRADLAHATAPAPALAWQAFPEAIVEIGHAGDGFSYDNEGPRHRQLMPAYALASRLVTNGEYLRFMEDGGYRRPEFWLADGHNEVVNQGWEAPLYWERNADGAWQEFTLAGPRPLDPDAPVCHVSAYEADAYARWAGARLPTEFELERAATGQPVRGNFVEQGLLHPRSAGLAEPAADGSSLLQLFGDAWEWTQSSYSAYPGYRPAPGALGEYNGKFMCNQFVLRGGSCATPREHIRATYRNFFPPDARWQFSGLRLARDAN